MKVRIPKNKKNTNIIEYINNFKLLHSANEDFEFIPEGTKVKLDYKNITSRTDYNRKTSAYRNFIETNKDKIFTVEYDKKFKNEPYLVCLKEDTTQIKWLWHSTLDLIVVNEN